MKINQVGNPIHNETISKVVQQSKPVVTQKSEVKDKTVEKLPGEKDLRNMDAKKGSEVVDEELLMNSVKQANKSLVNYNRYIEREVHEVTHSVMYKLKDNVTNEVIAEFPPKKIQDMIAKMWELAGLFVDEKA